MPCKGAFQGQAIDICTCYLNVQCGHRRLRGSQKWAELDKAEDWSRTTAVIQASVMCCWQDPGPDPANPFVNLTRQDALLRDTLSPKFAAELRFVLAFVQRRTYGRHGSSPWCFQVFSVTDYILQDR